MFQAVCSIMHVLDVCINLITAKNKDVEFINKQLSACKQLCVNYLPKLQLNNAKTGNLHIFSQILRVFYPHECMTFTSLLAAADVHEEFTLRAFMLANCAQCSRCSFKPYIVINGQKYK